MKISVNVTQEDIDNGVRGDACNCPVALAIGRATEHKYVVMAWREILLTIKCNIVYRIDTPRYVSNFIESFDAKRNVCPFSFNLEFGK